MNAFERTAAEELYDRIPPEVHESKLAGFTGGARFMAAALAILGYPDVRVPAGMESLGIVKYSIATIAALLAAGSTWILGAWWLAIPIFIVVFYGVESRFVFAFPLAVSNAACPMRTSHEMAGPVWSATPRVMRIAWHMLTGGLRGRGFVRSWCVGCLVVVLWFDTCRREGA